MQGDLVLTFLAGVVPPSAALASIVSPVSEIAATAAKAIAGCCRTAVPWLVVPGPAVAAVWFSWVVSPGTFYRNLWQAPVGCRYGSSLGFTTIELQWRGKLQVATKMLKDTNCYC
jgi:hypothetical protein